MTPRLINSEKKTGVMILDTTVYYTPLGGCLVGHAVVEGYDCIS